VFAAFDALTAREQGGSPGMIVGAALIEIHVHGSQSLKQKRGVVRSIVQRVRNRFNLAVAEVGGQDTWQRASLALGAVGSDERVLRGVLERAIDFIERLHLAEVMGSEIEILELPHEPLLDADDETWEERV
jgi:uncharacterized protein YlxP (DUF503 family)